MASPKRSPIEKASLKGLADQRYRKPLGRRAQERQKREYEKNLREL